MFRVLGLQPRVAELAFADVYAGASGEKPLVDLNLEAIGRAPRPIRGRIRLPSADFRTPDSGLPFDVKCNVRWASKPHHGLRGFWIDPRGLANEEIHGLVIEDWDSRGWSLCYVGALDARSAQSLSAALGLDVGLRGERARFCPFLFALPRVFQTREMEGATPVSAGENALDLLAGSPTLAHLAGYELRPEDRAALVKRCRISSEPSRSLVAEVLSRSSFNTWDLAPAHLWAASLHGLASVRGRADARAGREFLAAAKRVFGDALFPVVLPGATAELRGGYLGAWVEDVLEALNAHWDTIRCPRCGRRPERVVPRSLTAQGVLLGTVECRACGRSDGRTLVAHCSQCGRYPLVAGREDACPAGERCGGLRCPDDGSCRPGCVASA
jgi:hypothetical protein